MLLLAALVGVSSEALRCARCSHCNENTVACCCVRRFPCRHIIHAAIASTHSPHLPCSFVLYHECQCDQNITAAGCADFVEDVHPGIVDRTAVVVKSLLSYPAPAPIVVISTAVSCALQDPSYPVYVDTSVMKGNTGDYNPEASGFDGLEYMVCNPENDFFPDLSKVAKTGTLLLR
jgi:hypothetical protein